MDNGERVVIMARVDAVGNSLGVRRELAEGIRSLLGWRKGLQPDNGSRSSLGIGPGLDDAVGPHWEFARRFAKEIRKLARSTPGDHRKKIG
ncbi:hypothetical protein BHM03_00038309 [Ensete ventricosum]|nr:hypothetical protein BHM03_00038309 [Ensete ventricosum]